MRKIVASRMHLKRKMLSLRFESGSHQELILHFDHLERQYRGTGAKIEESVSLMRKLGSPD